MALDEVSEKGEFGPYRQSERTAIYKKYLQQLIESGDAYYCYCTKEDIEAQRQAMLSQGFAAKVQRPLPNTRGAGRKNAGGHPLQSAGSKS